MTGTLATTLLPLLMMVAAIGDYLSYRIPNWLTGLIALSFFPMALMMAMPADLLLWHVGTGAVLLAAGFGIFAMGWFGGGDAKLLAAAGLWFGWPAAMQFLVLTALAGGVLALAACLWSVLQADQEMRGHTWFHRLRNAKLDLPYGVAFAAGAVLAFPQTWWMQMAG